MSTVEWTGFSTNCVFCGDLVEWWSFDEDGEEKKEAFLKHFVHECGPLMTDIFGAIEMLLAHKMQLHKSYYHKDGPNA